MREEEREREGEGRKEKERGKEKKREGERKEVVCRCKTNLKNVLYYNQKVDSLHSYG